jgi:hypothetical protein
VNPVTGAGPENPRTSELLSLLRSYSQQLRSLEDQAAFIAQGRVALIDPPPSRRPPSRRSRHATGCSRCSSASALGFGLALLRDHLRDTIQDDLDVRRATRMRPLDRTHPALAAARRRSQGRDHAHRPDVDRGGGLPRAQHQHALPRDGRAAARARVTRRPEDLTRRAARR